MRRGLVFSAVLLAAALDAAPPEPAPVPQAEHGGVRAAVEVTALDLDVVATKDGKFVNDLTKDEFTVKVDGKPVPLDYFTRVTEGTLFGPDLSQASPDLILESLQNEAGAHYLSRQFLVFFDDDHMMPFDRPRVIEGLREFFLKLSPADRTSILRYDRAATRALVPFTNSKEELLDGLAKLEKMAPGGLSWYAQAQQDWNQARASSYYSRSSIIRNYGAQARVREQNALNDLRRAISALAARSGKRTLVYVGDGIELRPGEAFARAFSPGLQQFEYDVTKEYRSVIHEANESGVTMYTIDARGLTADTDASAQAPPDLAPFERHVIRREALAGFAAETGGAFFENQNVFKGAVDQIYRESSTFYSIGVTLASVPKKAEHSVKVSVSRSGVTVRTRSSFIPMTADKAARDRIEMALLNPEARGDFAVSLRLGPAKPGGLGRRLAPFEVRVPLAALTYKEAGGRKDATLDITIAAVQDDGARSDPATVRETVSLDPKQWDQDKDRAFIYTGEAKTRTGNMRFVASVRDVATNRIGLGSASVRIE